MYFGVTSFYTIPAAINKYINAQQPAFTEKLKQFMEDSKEAYSRANQAADDAKRIADNLLALQKKIRAGSAELHIESGEENVHHKEYPDLRTPVRGESGAVGHRGAMRKRIEFENPFQERPKVIVALTSLDHVIESRVNNLRIKASVSDIDSKGFSYSLLTWNNTDIWSAGLSWVAYGH